LGERDRLVKAALGCLAVEAMTRQSDREERLAAALRENLRKRKAQGREQDGSEEGKKRNPGSNPE
jgi:hypothetical protein